jgi:PKD repeat protein
VNRVSRFVLPDSSIVDPRSERVLIDRIPSPGGNHNGGDIQFGKDGTLYVSVGDGGCDYADDSGCGGTNDAARDPHVLSGKILRITRDGGIPPTNPFQGPDSARCHVNGRTDFGKKCRETFARGLRNPFRLAFDPSRVETRFFINDVGQGTWEEIDEGLSGADYGWNVREGHCANGSRTSCGPPPAGMTNPVFDYVHDGCNSITGGAFVPAGSWPSEHDGRYFFSDFVCGRIFELVPNGTGGYTRATFATGLGGASATHLVFGPDGTRPSLYYATYAGVGVRVIRYTGTANRAPTAAATAAPAIGDLPLTVTFDASATSDPDPGETLSYVWSFGDGSPEVETSAATVQHVYTAAGLYTAILRARDAQGALSDPFTITIHAGNIAPVAAITAPLVSTRFAVGQVLTLTGQATDFEDGALPASAFSWTAVLRHGDHTHPYAGPLPGNDVALVAPAPEDLAAAATSALEIELTATDSRGASHTVVRRLEPRLVAVSFATSPPGLQIEVNGLALAGPALRLSWEGYALGLNAPDQSFHGRNYVFAGWSDGGARSHSVRPRPGAPRTPRSSGKRRRSSPCRSTTLPSPKATAEATTPSSRRGSPRPASTP